VGTLRRNPDLKWRQSVQSLLELTALQARILASASRCVAPGGRLVYATCSLLKEENQDQAELFLANHPDFELVDAAPILAARTSLHIEGPYLSLRPDVHGTDGFFAAIFERKKNLVSEAVTKTSEEEEVEDLVEATDVIDPEVESEFKLETKPETNPEVQPKSKTKTKAKAETTAETKAIKAPAKKRVKAQKVEPLQPDLDSDRKDA
jgi:16S rRNA (cytosine967-C5)-methyltransferase